MTRPAIDRPQAIGLSVSAAFGGALLCLMDVAYVLVSGDAAPSIRFFPGAALLWAAVAIVLVGLGGLLFGLGDRVVASTSADDPNALAARLVRAMLVVLPPALLLSFPLASLFDGAQVSQTWLGTL
ncbi:MAG: hypothetical protein ACI9WU_002955, partial [Myxococcota bacterium]